MTLENFHQLAPGGFYLALHVGFAFPVAEHNYLPETWVKEYTLSGLMVHDPAMVWVYRNEGVARWRDLGIEDRLGVLDLAKWHGLRFGAVASCRSPHEAGQRSFGLFCRSDRDFSDADLADLNSSLRAAHAAHERPRNLTAAELQTLGLVKNGLLMKEMACVLGISESAIKQRLRSARVKLQAKTGSQAAAKATMLGMI